MKQVILFAGTTEGRTLSERLGEAGISALACTATEYGKELVEAKDSLEVRSGRLDLPAMKELFSSEQPKIVVDATHPYAAIVSHNIYAACEACEIPYLRLIRKSYETSLPEDCIVVDSVPEAAEYLKETEGNVLLTTGSKELHCYTVVPNYENRLFARVLSTPEVSMECSKLGFQGKNLICMQGPFSKDLNTAMLRQIHASYMVTKESGKAGGFPEKLEAAREAGVKLILVGRPPELPGKTPEEVVKVLNQMFEISMSDDFYGEGSTEETTDKTMAANVEKRIVTLIGIGMGSKEGMTIEGMKACEEADCIIGAKRMLEPVAHLGKPMLNAYKYAEIRTFADEHPQYRKISVVLSGDVGFYSGAKGLTEAFSGEDYEVRRLPGISSVVYLCSKLNTSWEDVKLCSVHGREGNLIAAIRENKKVFTLLSGGEHVHELCRELIEYGLSEVRISIGQRLGYADEEIVSGTPEELLSKEIDALCAAYIENDNYHNGVLSCLDDEEFIRAKVPMTKAEVRSVSVSKLRLKRDSVVYDVGAGTGSVTIEMALQASEGTVYAIERKEEGADLIEQNMKKLGTPNIRVIRGLAPQALEDLPAPTHVFIGGSAGNLKDILQLILKKNPTVRIVMNAVTLETIAEMNECLKTLPFTDTEITQLSVAKAKKLGGYELMMGQNPVYIVSCTGVKCDEIS